MRRIPPVASSGEGHFNCVTEYSMKAPQWSHHGRSTGNGREPEPRSDGPTFASTTSGTPGWPWWQWPGPRQLRSWPPEDMPARQQPFAINTPRSTGWPLSLAHLLPWPKGESYPSHLRRGTRGHGAPRGRFRRTRTRVLGVLVRGFTAEASCETPSAQET